ncbi:MAG: peptidyl-prolyl cis-trans isomerase [Acidobacteriota bacterium]
MRTIIVPAALSLSGLVAFAQAPAPAASKSVETRVEDVVAWVNDDIVTWSELQENEREMVAQLMQGKSSADEMTAAVDEVRQKVLGDLITDHLLVQEAERLFDLDAVKKDVLDNFKERNKLKGDAELDAYIKPYNMTRDELVRRLVFGAVPGYVIDNQVKRQLGVSQQESKAWYDTNIAKFTTPAQVTFRELLLTATDSEQLAKRKPEAEALLAQVQAGADFEALVKSKSEARSRATAGLIGPLDPNDLRPELRSFVVSTPVGQAAIVSTDSGWQIIKIEARQDPSVRPFEEVKTECEEAVRSDKAGPALKTYIEKLWKEAEVEVRKDYVDRLAGDLKRYVKVQ